MEQKEARDRLSLIRVGDLSRRTGKTVRALHLYEELGLLSAPVRTKGGFRMYSSDGVKRIEWIQKLQDIGFSLTEIKSFLRVWGETATASEAMATVREIFSEKLRETRDTISRLTRLANELQESLEYLEGCRSCNSVKIEKECSTCAKQGSERNIPLLVDGIAKHTTP